MELRIRDLSKTYPGGIRALEHVDLAIPAGMFGLLGPNGAGKTTLMRIIASLQAPDEGAIALDGLDVLDEPDQVRRILGYLPQEFGLSGDVSAEYLLGHIALLKGVTNAKERRQLVHFILEQTNLYGVRSRKLAGFSGGMKQRFGIAQALIGNPSLLIVDEPTAGLDPEERHRFHNILSDISQERIVILSTHIVDDVSVLCERFAILYEGRVLVAGTVEDAVERLRGRVWRSIVSKQEIPALDERERIIITRMLSGRVVVHVLSDARPKGFELVEPDLYDVYFTAIQDGRDAKRATAPGTSQTADHALTSHDHGER